MWNNCTLYYDCASHQTYVTDCEMTVVAFDENVHM